MEQKIKVRPNQSFLDVILQGCGTMEAGMQVAAHNGVPISYIPVVDSDIRIGDSQFAPIAIGVTVAKDAGVLKYLGQNSIVIGTLGNVYGDPLTTEDGSEFLSTEDGSGVLVGEG